MVVSLNSAADSIAYLVVIETQYFIHSDTMLSLDDVDYFIENLTGVSGVSRTFEHSNYFEIRNYKMSVYCEKKRVKIGKRGRIRLKRIK